MQNVLLVALGGGIGASCRYLLALYLDSITKTTFNIGTLSVNLIGSLLIGIIMGLISMQANISPKVFPFLVVGVLGGFTTFSSFSYDNFQLLEDGFYKSFIFYFLVSNLGGILLAFLGYKLANNINF